LHGFVARLASESRLLFDLRQCFNELDALHVTSRAGADTTAGAFNAVHLVVHRDAHEGPFGVLHDNSFSIRCDVGDFGVAPER